MSHTCCVSNCLTGRNLLRGLTLTVVAATAVLALTVLAPWRSLDAAAPATADDPLAQRQIVRPVPSAVDNRGLKNSGGDAEVLLNWNYTFTPSSDTF